MPEYILHIKRNGKSRELKLSTADLIDVFADNSIIYQDLPQHPGEKSKYAGLIKFSERKIYMDQNMDLAQKRETLLHEALHAINRNKAWDLTESDIEAIDHVLYRMIYGDEK